MWRTVKSMCLICQSNSFCDDGKNVETTLLRGFINLACCDHGSCVLRHVGVIRNYNQIQLNTNYNILSKYCAPRWCQIVYILLCLWYCTSQLQGIYAELLTWVLMNQSLNVRLHPQSECSLWLSAPDHLQHRLLLPELLFLGWLPRVLLWQLLPLCGPGEGWGCKFISKHKRWLVFF